MKRPQGVRSLLVGNVMNPIILEISFSRKEESGLSLEALTRGDSLSTEKTKPFKELLQKYSSEIPLEKNFTYYVMDYNSELVVEADEEKKGLVPNSEIETNLKKLLIKEAQKVLDEEAEAREKKEEKKKVSLEVIQNAMLNPKDLSQKEIEDMDDFLYKYYLGFVDSLALLTIAKSFLDRELAAENKEDLMPKFASLFIRLRRIVNSKMANIEN